MNRKYRAFTLIEILVVLAIIMMLAALLFPVFQRIQESGGQANCAANLKSIYFATSQYHDDTGRYPTTLRVLLPKTVKLADYGKTPTEQIDNIDTTTGIGGKGYLRDTNSLLCPNDDTEPGQDKDDKPLPRSTYGDVSTAVFLDSMPAVGDQDPEDSPYKGPKFEEDPTRYLWNFWGLNDKGFAYPTWEKAADETRTATKTEEGAVRLVFPDVPWNRRTNPIKRSLSNRDAPKETIITHCIFHRLQTASDLAAPLDLYADAEDSKLARDIVLRLDGSAKAVDVSSWQANSQQWLTTPQPNTLNIWY